METNSSPKFFNSLRAYCKMRFAPCPKYTCPPLTFGYVSTMRSKAARNMAWLTESFFKMNGITSWSTANIPWSKCPVSIDWCPFDSAICCACWIASCVLMVNFCKSICSFFEYAEASSKANPSRFIQPFFPISPQKNVVFSGFIKNHS